MWLPILIVIFKLGSNLESLEISHQDFPDAITKQLILALEGCPSYNYWKYPAWRPVVLKSTSFEN